MSIPCRLIEVEERAKRCECTSPHCPGYLYTELVDRATGQPPCPGDMWFAQALDFHPSFLSPQYWTDAAPHREPLMVKLPGGMHFCVDQVYVNEGGLLGTQGWQVSGVAPWLTLLPSINAKGSWHGYLTDGVLSNDLERRA
jgi:hypothetical protein